MRAMAPTMMPPTEPSSKVPAEEAESEAASVSTRMLLLMGLGEGVTPALPLSLTDGAAITVLVVEGLRVSDAAGEAVRDGVGHNNE